MGESLGYRVGWSIMFGRFGRVGWEYVTWTARRLVGPAGCACGGVCRGARDFPSRLLGSCCHRGVASEPPSLRWLGRRGCGCSQGYLRVLFGPELERGVCGEGHGTTIPKSAARLRLLSEPCRQRKVCPIAHRDALVRALPERRGRWYVILSGLRSSWRCEREGRLSAKQLFQLCSSAPSSLRRGGSICRAPQRRGRREAERATVNFRWQRARGFPHMANYL